MDPGSPLRSVRDDDVFQQLSADTARAADDRLTMTTSLPNDALALLKRLGVPESAYASAGLSARSPITGETVATLRETSPAEAEAAIGRAQSAYLAWQIGRAHV